ncbi:MAG: hypothetical protein ACYS4T_18230 [Planctomycetota bacterium]|jgi:hypothetical protein
MDWALTGTTIGLIIAFCYLLDWLVSKEEEDRQKVTIIRWWFRLDDFSYAEAVRNSNIFCNEILNKIYGKRHFSLRCIGVSFCVSILSVLIPTIVAFNIIKFNRSRFVIDTYGSPYLYALLFASLVNSSVDYISLIETRVILRFASRVKPLILLVLLFVDLFFSAIIFLFLTLFATTVGSIVDGEFSKETYIGALGLFGLVEVKIMFCSTFSTSIIFYIYCLCTLFFKFVKLSKTRIMVVLEKLEDSDHLFKALGGGLAAVLVFVKCVVEVIQHIMQA